MLSIINSLAPVLLVILLGLFLKRFKLIEDHYWTGIENLCYYILFPALLIKTLATARIDSTELLSFSGMVLFAIISMSLIMLALYPLLRRTTQMSPAAFTSLFQGATRWHGFIALSIAGFLLGDEAVAYMAVTMAVIIPPLNVINVWVLAHFANGDTGLKSVLLKLLKNPFIISCASGAFLNLSGIGLSGPIYASFDMLGSGALGMALMAVGAGLIFREVRQQRLLVLIGSTIRLLVMPALMFLGAWLFDVDGVARTVAVIAGAVPTAASAFVLARQMGGDAALMASLITVQVVLSILTLPLMIYLAQMP
jgi:malonate transporter